MVSLIGGYRSSRRLFTAMLLLSKKNPEKSSEKIDLQWSSSMGEYGVQNMLYEHKLKKEIIWKNHDVHGYRGNRSIYMLINDAHSY